MGVGVPTGPPGKGFDRRCDSQASLGAQVPAVAVYTIVKVVLAGADVDPAGIPT